MKISAVCLMLLGQIFLDLWLEEKQNCARLVSEKFLEKNFSWEQIFENWCSITKLWNFHAIWYILQSANMNALAIYFPSCSFFPTISPQFLLSLLPTSGDGKTHYIQQQLACSPASLTVSVNEAFTPLKAISKLRTLPLNQKNCAIFFNFTMLPPGVSGKKRGVGYAVLLTDSTVVACRFR